jgi:hypothetical protein
MDANALLDRGEVLEAYRRIAERVLEPELVTTLEQMLELTAELRTWL